VSCCVVSYLFGAEGLEPSGDDDAEQQQDLQIHDEMPELLHVEALHPMQHLSLGSACAQFISACRVACACVRLCVRVRWCVCVSCCACAVVRCVRVRVYRQAGEQKAMVWHLLHRAAAAAGPGAMALKQWWHTSRRRSVRHEGANA
jgi:hypothetical protein